jgi:CTP synthase (UTP-ammonia lyase)
MEEFQCNYGLNPQFRNRFERAKLKITGLDLEGEVRIVELTDHPFYIATLFLPQLSSRPGNPHPLIVSYLKASLAFRRAREKSES